MVAPGAETPRTFSLRNTPALGLWLAALLGALSVATLPGDWGHAICGPWGCGPPLQALVGCHLAWLVSLAPVARMWGPFRTLTPQRRRAVGATLLASGLALIFGTAIYEGVTWWTAASEYQQAFFWHRWGFAVATNVDVPMAQLAFSGAILLWQPDAFKRRIGIRRAEISSDDTSTTR